MEQELLPESVREDVVEEVELDLDSGESAEKLDSDIYENLVEHLEKWQGISLYQTGNMIGFVIPTGLVSDPYVIHEVWNDAAEDEYYGVSFAEIDWEAYQYRMFATEYQDLQDYMPVLTGGAEFILEPEAAKSENMTIISWAEEYYDEDAAEAFPVYEVCIRDLTQDGKPELILNVFAGMHLILHKKGNTYYGKMEGRRSLYRLQTNGVYGSGKEDYHLFQMHFKKDHFADEYLGGYESHDDDFEYYIQDQKVKKSVYEKWEKSIMTENVSWYSTEAIWNEG